MDSRILDVLHDPANDTTGAIGDGVDVGLEGVFQKAVYQNRVLWCNPRCTAEIVPE